MVACGDDTWQYVMVPYERIKSNPKNKIKDQIGSKNKIKDQIEILVFLP